MKHQKMLCALALMASLGASAQQAPQVMEGDERLACEAILCLAASTRPAECVPSIRKYFSISFRLFSDTLRGRLNFLNLCPTGNAPGMAPLKSALVNGAGRCDAASINVSNWVGAADGGGVVIDRMPEYCSAMASNSYVASPVLPRYVGTPERGGYWVEAKDYESALKAYNDKAAADAAAQTLQ
jgi:hypothetical protein